MERDIFPVVHGVRGKPFYSVRMRASRHGRHLSGAERLIPASRLAAAVTALLRRGLSSPVQQPDRVILRVDPVAPRLLRPLSALPIQTLKVSSPAQGRLLASRLLQASGVAPRAVRRAMRDLRRGAAGGGQCMRGAMLVDAQSGRRLEADPQRGVRVSRVDWDARVERRLVKRLARYGLTHHRLREALALASKVAAAPGMVAELCWSDDPTYTTGYVSTPRLGYVRIAPLKAEGDPLGGRAFFIRAESLSACVAFLERIPCRIVALGSLTPPRTWRA